MVKKFISLMLVLSMVLCLFAGCTNSYVDSEGFEIVNAKSDLKGNYSGTINMIVHLDNVYRDLLTLTNVQLYVGFDDVSNTDSFLMVEDQLDGEYDSFTDFLSETDYYIEIEIDPLASYTDTYGVNSNTSLQLDFSGKFPDDLIGKTVNMRAYITGNDSVNSNQVAISDLLVLTPTVVASISETDYSTLQDAVDDVKPGETIVLKDDIESDTNVVINTKTNFTIDENGKTNEANITAKMGTNEGLRLYTETSTSGTDYETKVIYLLSVGRAGTGPSDVYPSAYVYSVMEKGEPEKASIFGGTGYWILEGDKVVITYTAPDGYEFLDGTTRKNEVIDKMTKSETVEMPILKAKTIEKTENRFTVTVEIGKAAQNPETEDNPNTGASVMTIASAAVLAGAALIVAKKYSK